MITRKRKLLIKFGVLISAFVGLICCLVVPTRAEVTEQASYVATPYNAYIEYYTNDNDNSLCTYYFVYHGDRYMHAEKVNASASFDYYVLDSSQKELVDTYFVSDYGWFIEDYNGNNGIVAFINEFASDSNRYLDKSWRVVFEFQAPIEFVNTPFNTAGQLCNVYYGDRLITTFSGFTLENFTATKFELYGNNDFGVKPTYLSSNTLDLYWSGYFKAKSEDSQQITQLQNANQTLLNQLANLNDNNGTRLIWAIASTPFESFKTIWDVDVMGLNIGGIVLGSMVGLLIVWILKKIF